MSYENINTLEDFRALDADQQRACVEEKQAAARAYLERRVEESFQWHELERQLVPRIPTRPADPPPPVEPIGIKLDQPAPSAVEESRARRIFSQNPGINEIQIGSTIYFRRSR